MPETEPLLIPLYAQYRLLFTLTLTVGVLIFLWLAHRVCRRRDREISTHGFLSLGILLYLMTWILRLAGQALRWQLERNFALHNASLSVSLAAYARSLIPELLLVVIGMCIFIPLRRLRRPFALRLGLVSALCMAFLPWIAAGMLLPPIYPSHILSPGELQDDLCRLARRIQLSPVKFLIEENPSGSAIRDVRLQGFGSGRQIVIDAELLRHFPRREVQALVARALARGKLGHLALTPLAFSLLLLFACLLTERIFALERGGAGLPLAHGLEAGDASALLLSAFLSLLLLTPLVRQCSHRLSAEANREAVRLLADTESLQTALERLQRKTLDPADRDLFFFSPTPGLCPQGTIIRRNHPGPPEIPDLL